jgi:choline dehydrogenase
LKVGLLQPKSRGQVLITGPNPDQPVALQTGYFDNPDDFRVAAAGLELCEAIGNASPLARYIKRRVIPDGQVDMAEFVRQGVKTFHHQTCTAKMGCDEFSVVDAQLRVYGVEALRIADGSVFPRIPRGNTMAPCVVVGERAADLLRAKYRI